MFELILLMLLIIFVMKIAFNVSFGILKLALGLVGVIVLFALIPLGIVFIVPALFVGGLVL